MSDFKEGLYDQLITHYVREALTRQSALGLQSSVEAIEANDFPEYLARHLIRQIKVALHSVSVDDRKRLQIELANSLIEFVRSREDLITPDLVDAPGEVPRRGWQRLKSAFHELVDRQVPIRVLTTT